MTDFDELMIRIPIETAVLFLGQMYEKNGLFGNLKEKYRGFALGGEKNTSYSDAVINLINYCEEKTEEKNAIISSIMAAENAICDNRFEKIVSLQWNGIVTSLMHSMPGFDSLQSVVCNSDIKTDYFSKKT